MEVSRFQWEVLERVPEDRSLGKEEDEVCMKVSSVVVRKMEAFAAVACLQRSGWPGTSSWTR